jgi:hypothetical protein
MNNKLKIYKHEIVIKKFMNKTIKKGSDAAKKRPTILAV